MRICIYGAGAIGAWLGVELDGPQEQFQRFLGWVDVHAGPLLVELPDGPFTGRGFLGRLMAFDPAVEAGLMGPQIMAMSQHTAGLDPDYLLMNKEAALSPGLLNQGLSLVSVPLVDGRVGL